MSFTDRFISIPTQVYNTKMADLTGKEEYFDGLSKISPFEISEYYKSWSDGIEVTQIYMKNGRSFLGNIPFDEFEKLLNTWQNKNQ